MAPTSLTRPRAADPYLTNVPRLFAFTFLWFFFLWMPIWVIYLQRRGMTLAQIGTLDAIGWLLQSLAELPTGAVADVYGRRVSMALGALLLAVAMFTVQLELMSPLFLLGYMLWGVSHTLANGADMAFLYDSLKAAGREEEYVRRAGQHTAVMWTSQSLAAVAGGWLAQFDMGLCFTLSGLLALAAAGVALTFREPPRSAPAAPRAGYVRTLREGAALALRDPLIRHPLVLGGLSGAFGMFLVFMLLQPYARAVGLPLPALGVLALAARGAGVAGSLAAGRLGGRLRPERGAAAGLLAFASCLVLMAAAPSLWSLGLLLTASLAGALARPLLSHEVNRRVPSERRATVLSLQAVLFTAVLVMLEPAVFAVADRYGVDAGMAVTAAAFLAGAGPVLARWRQALAAERAAA